MPPLKGDDHARETRTIKRQKIWIIALVLVVATIVFYWLDANSNSLPIAQLRPFPWGHLGEATLVSFFIAFAYEWAIRSENQKEIYGIVLEVFIDQMTSAEKMCSLLSTSMIDNVLRTTLLARIHNSELAIAAYEHIMHAFIAHAQTMRELEHHIALRAINDYQVPEIIRNNYYQAHFTVEYSTTLSKRQFLFACSPTINQRNSLLRDPNVEQALCFPPKPELPQIDTRVFDVEYVRVSWNDDSGDGRQVELQLRREYEDGQYIVTAHHPELEGALGKRARVSYRYAFKTSKRAHYVWVDVHCLTEGVFIEFDYGTAGVGQATAADFIMSRSQPQYQYWPTREESTRITVRVDDWVLPKSGLVFGWEFASAELIESTQKTPQY